MDIFCKWIVRRLYRAGFAHDSCKRNIKIQIRLVGVQEFRWGRGGTEPVGEYTFLYGKGNKNRELGTGFFIHTITSAINRV
jgi:hypothetical protein